MKHLRKPTRKVKEMLSNHGKGCIKLNPANWYVERQTSREVVCVNVKTGKKLTFEAA